MDGLKSFSCIKVANPRLQFLLGKIDFLDLRLGLGDCTVKLAGKMLLNLLLHLLALLLLEASLFGHVIQMFAERRKSGDSRGISCWPSCGQ